MALGLANIVAGFIYGIEGEWDVLVAGPWMGGLWFAYGMYGGFPLFDTVADWHPPVTPDSIEEMHRRGLLVMRRRRRVMWAAAAGTFVAASLVVPACFQAGCPELALLLLAPPLSIVYTRYYLSRCPRCGLGFFMQSASRAAWLRRWRRSCGNCGLPLRAYRERD